MLHVVFKLKKKLLVLQLFNSLMQRLVMQICECRQFANIKETDGRRKFELGIPQSRGASYIRGVSYIRDKVVN